MRSYKGYKSSEGDSNIKKKDENPDDAIIEKTSRHTYRIIIAQAPTTNFPRLNLYFHCDT